MIAHYQTDCTQLFPCRGYAWMLQHWIHTYIRWRSLASVPCFTHACLLGILASAQPDSPQAEVMRQNMHTNAANPVNDIHSLSRDLYCWSSHSFSSKEGNCSSGRFAPAEVAVEQWTAGASSELRLSLANFIKSGGC